MFEKYKIPAFFICRSAVLAAFSCGRSTCLTFDSGDSASYAVPVNDGFALQKSLLKFDVGGSFITNEVLNLIESKTKGLLPHYMLSKSYDDGKVIIEKNYNKAQESFDTYWRREIARDAKENLLGFWDETTNL